MAVQLRAGRKRGTKFPADVRRRLLVAFGEDLRAHRKAAGLSQEALAKLTDLHFSEVSLLERGGREPRLITALKLAAALDISIDQLFETAAAIYRYSEQRGSERMAP